MPKKNNKKSKKRIVKQGKTRKNKNKVEKQVRKTKYLNKKYMGYGFGIWLVVSNKTINDFIKKHNIEYHIGHITVKYSMNLQDARYMFTELTQKNVDISSFATYISDLAIFKGYKYFKEDNLEACGYYMEIPNWKQIVEIGNKYSGSFPSKPHLSLIYRNDYKKLVEYCQNITPPKIKSKKCKVKLCLVDITSNNPNNWRIIKSFQK